MEDGGVRALVAHAQVGLAELDRDGTFTCVNPYLCALLGYGEADLLHRRFHDITHPDDRAHCAATFRQAVASGEPVMMDKRYVRPDGTVVWVSDSVSVRPAAPGQPTRVTMVVTDITARHRAEDAVHASEGKYRSLFESIEQGFCIVQVLFDAHDTPIDYRFLEVNGAFAAQTGIDKAVGRRMRELAPHHEAHWFAIYGQVALTGQPVQFEQRADQLHRWFDVSAFRIGDPHERKVAILFTDITVRKQAEEAVRASEARFRALVTATTYVVYRMSPDWREMRQLAGQGFLTDTAHPNTAWLDDYIFPDDQPQVLAAIGAAVRTKGVFELEHRVRRADEGVGWTLSRAVPVLDPTGEITEWFGAASDITARKQAEDALRANEERQAFLLQLADALRPLADATEIQAEATRMLGEHLGVDRAYYVELHEAEGYTRVAHNYLRGDSPSLAGTYAVSAYDWTVPILRRGETIIVEDADVSDRIPEAQRAPMRSVRIRAHITAPLVKSGMLAGSLCVTEAVPRTWAASDVALVHETAERIWAAVERANAEEAVRRNEQRTRIQNEAFQLAINGEPLARALNTLTRIVTQHVGSEVRTAFYLAYPDGARLHAIAGAGDMPATFTQPLDGFPIGDESFCSGYAIATGRPALTRDVLDDPRWHPYRQLASAHHVRACGSYPILTREGKAVGSFAMYFSSVHEATPQDRAVADAVTQAAAIILARHTEALERARAEAAVRASHARRQFVLESARIGEWELDVTTGQARHSFIHDQCFGATTPFADWSYDRFLTYVHPDDRPDVDRTFGEAIRERHPWNFECRVVWADGNVHWIQAQGYVYRDDGDHPSRMLGIVSDITERKQAEAALREGEARFRTVTDAVPQVIWANDAAGHAIYFNERWFAYSGKSLDESVGPGWQVIVHPDDAPASVERWQQALAAGTIFDTEYRLRRADGGYRWHLGRNVPVHDDGQVIGWFGSATDIHDERLAREAAQAAHAAAEAALATRDQFLSIASHELRTPLTALLGYASMLTKVAAGDKAAQMSTRIVRQAERLNRLIDQLLNIARLQQGQFVVARRPLNVTALVNEVVDEVRATLPSHGTHTLTLHVPADPIVVDGDAERLEQVLHNLLSNAIKYSPHGGRVAVQLTRTPTEAVLAVTDAGIGIPLDAQARLFEPFYRASNVGGQASGFGLGLHIVREIVARHGGRMEVDSTEGVGSTFRVVLPLHQTAAAREVGAAADAA